jgi:hypothetical protein
MNEGLKRVRSRIETRRCGAKVMASSRRTTHVVEPNHGWSVTDGALVARLTRERGDRREARDSSAADGLGIGISN